MNIHQMKRVDAVVGRMAATLFPSPQQCGVVIPVLSLLLIRPGGIGDAVLLAPVISALKNQCPGVMVTVLAEERNAGVFSLVPEVDQLFCYDRPRELFRCLNGSYDAVIDSEQWHRLSALVARMVMAPVKIGFATNERSRMFTHSVPYCHEENEMVSFARLLEPLGIIPENPESGTPFLTLPNAAVATADRLLESVRDRTFVTIFPGASIVERRWGAERFRRLAEMLSVFGIRAVVVGGDEDREQGKAISVDGMGLNLAGLTSLPDTAAVIQRSSLLVSGDSGILHIAVGLDVPTVSLFGPGRAKKWAPPGDRHLVINKELDCSPCTTFGTTPRCSRNAQCMRDIAVDEVLNAVTMLLTSVGAMKSHCCKREWLETA